MKRPVRTVIAISLLVSAVALGGVAAAAGTSLSFKVKGQYAKRYRTACGKVHKHFRFFHRGSTIEARGFLLPPPSSHFFVRIEIKRCVHGSWREIGNRTAEGKPLTGKFKGFFSARPLAPRSHKRGAIVFYRARAVLGTTVSPYDYFAVTN